MSIMFPLCWVKHFTCLVLLCTLLKYQGANITHGKCICPGVNGTYNIMSLQRTDDKPRFNTLGQWHYIYYYNPCSSFQMPDADNGCINDAAVCWGGKSKGPYFKIGDQSTAWCGSDPETGRPELLYKTANFSGEEYHVRVILTCDWSKETPDFEQIHRKGLYWVFSLTHRCACPNGCPDDPSPTTSATAPSRASRTTTRAITETKTAPYRTTGKTANTLVPPIQDDSLTPLPISLVALGVVSSIILAVISIRFCPRWWRHNEDNDIRQHLLAGAVEVIENNFPELNNGRRIENPLNISQQLPVSWVNSNCNITLSKKDNFNKGQKL
ncbi:uncharacterized protein [Montipora capricornis]|uniref:uncharacterized protein isoform X3 n=1 Tax=Montipora capricornis TaxID=246305 RepID=UPI0035F120D2